MPATDEGPLRSLEREERARIVHRGLRALPADLREPLVLCDLQGLPYEEIAASLRIPLGTVKSRINRGRLELARRLLGARRGAAEQRSDAPLDCARAEELLSDDCEGTLDALGRAPTSRPTWPACAECRALREALADVISRPARARHRARAPTSRSAWPRRVAARARILRAGASALAARPRPGAGCASRPSAARRWPSRSRRRHLLGAAGRGLRSRARGARLVAARLANAGVYLVERKDRLVEDFRMLRVVVATAFEGRLDRVNDRVDDYRRLLEQPQERAGARARAGRQEERGGAPNAVSNAAPAPISLEECDMRDPTSMSPSDDAARGSIAAPREERSHDASPADPRAAIPPLPPPWPCRPAGAPKSPVLALLLSLFPGLGPGLQRPARQGARLLLRVRGLHLPDRGERTAALRVLHPLHRTSTT